jgi:thiosulfate/3-mercaptopyruvate sulfurtransferase
LLKMRRLGRPLAFALGLATSGAGWSADDFLYVADLAADDQVRIDTRPLADCQRASLPKARCLPADDFLGPHRRLPGEREILWLLGTAGLDGSETVLVAGETATKRDFVAGLLYLAGQRAVRVLTPALSRQLARAPEGAPGQARGIVRQAVFTASMRAERIVLQHELSRGIAETTLVDGRSESEYWGETVRGARGGHLPGALRLPASTVPITDPRPVLPAASAVAYAHDALEGIAYFTRLAAGHALPVRVYAGGWAEWAADGSLPIDAASFPERVADTPAPAAPPSPGLTPAYGVALVAALLAAFAGGWHGSTRRRN